MTKTVAPPRREPSGRRQRKSTQEALNEINARQTEEIVGVVARQPHRREFDDPRSPLVGCAIGRFVMRHRMAREVIASAEVYGDTKRKWLAAKGAPGEVDMGGNGGDWDEAAVRKFFEVFKAIESSVATVAGMNALSLIEAAAVRDFDIPENFHAANVRRGLEEMAYCTGHLERPRDG